MRAAGYPGSYAARCLIGLAVALLAILILPGSVLATAPGANGKIYYQGPQSGETGPTDIFSINPDGSEALDLTSGNGLSEERPNVSADGQHVVFQSFRDDGWNIFSMNADGSNQVDLTNTEFEPTTNHQLRADLVSGRDQGRLHAPDPNGKSRTSGSLTRTAPTRST